MAYTFHGKGTVNGASIGTGGGTLSPGAPSGVTAGDLLLCVVACRASPGTITISGYERIDGSASGSPRGPQIFARIATGTSDTPTVSIASMASTEWCYAQYARFSGSYATIGTAGADIREQTPQGQNSTSTGTIPTDGTTQGVATPSVDGCLVIYAGYQRIDNGPATAFPNSSTVIGDDVDANNSYMPWSYAIQTTAAAIPSSSFTNTASLSATSYSVTLVLLPSAAAKYLKILADSAAASATGVDVVVYSAPSGSNYVTGTTRYGSATGQAFEASLESGEAVLKILATDVGCDGLAAATSVRALAQNTTYTTGMVTATIIEE